MIISSSNPDCFAIYILIDAKGEEIMMCTWADTVTGEVVVIDRDDEGSPVTTIDDTGEIVVKTKWMKYEPPLTIVPLQVRKGQEPI